MRSARVLVVGLATVLVATAIVGAFSLVGGSDDGGGRAFYFSVASKNATGTGCFQGGCFIAMFGSGTFEGSDAEGTGIFSISTGLPPSSTNSVASGSWQANKVISFTSYGVANERSEGGLLVLNVILHFDGSGVVTSAALTITCRVGSPPATAKEGATLSAGSTFNFDTPVTGITTFSAPAED
ncbi:MAG TPA: hypothetical protein VGA48_08335 [Thermoplasmata archaeon]